MKTKLSLIIISVFMMACGSTVQPKEPENGNALVVGDAKYIIKAFNMQYLTIAPNNLLVANQADPTKAEVFTMVDLGNGKYNLKASNGMFVSDDRGRGDSIFVDKPNASGWEEFEVIALDESKVNFKTSAEKYISSDLGSGAFLVSRYDKANDWETFFLEKK